MIISQRRLQVDAFSQESVLQLRMTQHRTLNGKKKSWAKLNWEFLHSQAWAKGWSGPYRMQSAKHWTACLEYNLFLLAYNYPITRCTSGKHCTYIFIWVKSPFVGSIWGSGFQVKHKVHVVVYVACIEKEVRVWCYVNQN